MFLSVISTKWWTLEFYFQFCSISKVKKQKEFVCFSRLFEFKVFISKIGNKFIWMNWTGWHKCMLRWKSNESVLNDFLNRIEMLMKNRIKTKNNCFGKSLWIENFLNPRSTCGSCLQILSFLFIFFFIFIFIFPSFNWVFVYASCESIGNCNLDEFMCVWTV